MARTETTHASTAPQPDHTPDWQAPDAPVPPPPEKPDPAKAEAFRAEAWGYVVSLIEQIAETLPQLHGLQARIAAMRAAWDAAVFHESTLPPPPPPAYEALPYGATAKEIEDRIKMLEGLKSRSEEQEIELTRLKGTL